MGNPHAKPFLKWAGGKRQLLPELLARVPAQFGTYYEPFLGGGAVYFALWNAGRIERAVLSDLNRELVGTYQALRDDPDQVIGCLGKHKNEKDYYYRARAIDPGSLSPAERAARMIYLNKTGFNGLYRVNSQGKFNVPFGENPNRTLGSVETLNACALALKPAKLSCASFEQITERAQVGDFVYFDPPYQPLSKTASFTSYSRDGFNDNDQRRLRDAFCDLAQRGVRVLLSNSDVPAIRDLYSAFTCHTVSARRAINSVATRRGAISELLISANLM